MDNDPTPNSSVNEQNLDDSQPNSQSIPTPPLRRSARICDLSGNAAISGNEIDEDISVIEANLEAAHSEMGRHDPRSYCEAMQGPNATDWQEVMEDGIQ